jgi:uncharacterized protein
MSDHIKTVQDAYAAFGPEAVSFIIGISSPDVVMDSRYPEGVPAAGVFRGHRGIAEFFQAVGESLELKSFEPLAYFGGKDTVVVLGREEGTVRRTQRPFKNEWVHVWTFVEGKLTGVRSINDTLAAYRAFGLEADPAQAEATRRPYVTTGGHAE